MKNEHESDQNIPNILIVDDIGANLKLLRDILKVEGYKIRPVSNGDIALQVAEKEKPDLILLDIMMPGINGYEVCRRLKENPDLSDIPVIFISALSDTKDIVKALALGGVDFINKPFQAEEVKARVNTHLKLKQQSKELKRQSQELQQQSKKLQELNATKDKFFSILAHDLRNPFIGFLGLTKMMAEEIKNLSPAEIEDMVGMLNKSAVDLFSLLENLLEWAKMQRGITNFNPKSFSLLCKVSGCMELAADAARTKEIITVTNIPDNLEVYADVRMFETVIRNLICNAVKFTPKKGKITVSASKIEENFIEIAVRDSGIGMHKELMSKLFKLDEPTGRKGTEGEPSSGLGLII
ncbi:MAG: response regulator, partial [Bacteroidota bacterium]